MAAKGHSDSTGRPVERRGFALYVGLSESRARRNEVELADVVEALKRELAHLVPSAESHAVAVVGPDTEAIRDLDAVMNAVGHPYPDSASFQRRYSLPIGEVGVVIDLARHRVLVDERDIRLTFKEFSLLQELVINDRKTLTRAHLRQAISDGSADDVNERAIDLHIRRLRVKFGAYPDLIRTVQGRGYRFERRQDVAVLWSSTPSPDGV